MKHLFALVLCALVGCATQSRSDDELLDSMLSGKAPRAQLSASDQARVDSSPLGSEHNPVRAGGPAGQRAYLDRLVCPEGKPPTYERAGSAGMSPYGAIMDIYTAACDAPPTRSIYIDMYHADYVELRAVTGFTIEPPEKD